MKILRTLVVIVSSSLWVSAALAQQPEDVAEELAATVGPEVSLEQLREHARDQAPEVLEAAARQGLGEAAIAGAAPAQRFNPELEAKVGAGLQEGSLANVELMLTQKVEVFGQPGRRRLAARRKADRLEVERQGVLWRLDRRLERLYRRGLVQKRRVAIERQSVAFADELVEIVAERVALGDEAEISAVLARAELAGARQGQVEAFTTYRATLRELGEVAGWPADRPPQPAGQLPEVRPTPAIEALLERAFERDTELASLQARLEQARAERAVAERAGWPDPTLGVGWERESRGELDPEDKLLFVLGIPLPIWERNQGDIAATSAREDILEQAIENRRALLESRVRELAARLDDAARQLRLFRQEVLPAFEAQLDMLQEGFELGELSLVDVLNARERLVDAQRRQIEALAAYVEAKSELEASVGALTEARR